MKSIKGIFSDESQGLLPGWWLGEEDNRVDEPYISVERWDEELRAAGFSGVDSALYDDDIPYQINVNIVSSPAQTISYGREVTLLCDTDFSPIVRQIEALFVQAGFRVDLSTLDQMPPLNNDVISLLDLAAPFFDEVSAQKLSAFQHYVGNLKSTGLLWASRSSQIGCKDPRYSQVLGIARTIRSELLVDFATFEMDTVDSVALEALVGIFGKFQRRIKGPDFDPDWEFALFEGIVHIPRYRWVSISQKLAIVGREELPRTLEVGKAALLQTLRWVQGKTIALKDDQVDVELCAVGLNFKVSCISKLLD